MVVLLKLKGIFFGRYLWVTNTVSGGKLNLFSKYGDSNIKSVYESTTGVLLAAGDFIQQNIERTNTTRNSSNKQHRYDLERSGMVFQPLLEKYLHVCFFFFKYFSFYCVDFKGRMAIIGLGLGLPHHFWYSFLDRILPGTRLLSIARKIILDQAAFSPFANFFFFMGSGVLEGHSVQQSWKEFKTKFPMVYKVCIYFFFPFLNYN